LTTASFTRPHVSVIMSVYNDERYLREAVDSILAQTFIDFELVIIDDGSNDETATILSTYQDPRIAVHRQANRGLVAALNRGLALARGELLARMDADDRSHPERLQKQVAFLNQHPTIGLVGTACRIIDETGVSRAPFLHYPTDSSHLQAELLLHNCFCHGSVMFRRACIEQVGMYRPECAGDGDYDLWLRISEHFAVANLDEPLYDYRSHAQSISAQLRGAVETRDVMAVKQALQRREKAMQEGDPASCHVLARGYVSVACAEIRLHRFQEARQSLVRALALSDEIGRLDRFPEPIFSYLNYGIDWGWLDWDDAIDLMHCVFNHLPATAYDLRLAQQDAIIRLLGYISSQGVLVP
jgi:glycosyltransferase involved in cell wall biosynthesis